MANSPTPPSSTEPFDLPPGSIGRMRVALATKLAKEKARNTKRLHTAMAVAAGLWFLVAIGVIAWLTWAVPLSEADLAQVSWLAYSGLSVSGSGASLLIGIPLMVLTVCGAHAHIHKSWLPLVAGVLASCALLAGSWPPGQVRVGLLEGTARIGCFVPNTIECQKMLGASDEAISKAGLGSLRPNDAERAAGSRWSAPYAEARSSTVPKILEMKANVLVLPGIPTLFAPRHWNQAEKLRELVEHQRTEAAKQRLN